jgi:hypothetical protein
MPLHSRQGDLLFVVQDTRPAGGLTAQQSNVIVAGGATSHAHRLTAGTILEAPDGARSLDLPSPTKAAHAEHGPLTLDPGLWLVVRKPEYSPQGIRTVLD